jgi:hypothetical protein
LIGFCFVLGVGNLLLNYLPKSKRKQGFLKRHSLGCIAIFLLLIGVVSAVVTFYSYQNGDKTVQVQVLEKTENLVKCNNRYCVEYGVDTTDGQKRYAFGLSKETWDKMETGACYRFTYYPLKPLLAEYLQAESQSPSQYETTGYITLIQRSVCQ